MPIEYAISHDLDLCYARHVGKITLDDYLENWATYVADPDYRAGRPEILDLSRALLVDLGLEHARRLLSEVNAQGGGTPVRTVTSVWAPSDLAFGISRMYESLASMVDGIEVFVTRSEREALDRLGLTHGSIAELLSTGGFQGGTMFRGNGTSGAA